MKRKRICAWFITVAMLLTMLPSAFAVSFADTRGHWAEDSINRWSDRGVIQGHDGDFEPNSPITRADMAVIIDRVMDYQTKAENKFSDLDNAYYKDPILRAAQAGVMQGDGKNVRPKDKITREEAVSMLARALSVTAGGSSTNFADNSRISPWAMSNVAAFAENGYIAGRSGNRFEPQANITHAEVVKLLDNMISDYITESGTATPKGTGIVIVKASGVTLNKAKLSSTVVLGGKAGEVKATDCEITGKVVKIHNSTLVTSGSTSTGGSTGGSSGGGSSAPAAPSAYPLPKGQETSKSLGVFNYDMTYFVTLTAQDGADIYAGYLHGNAVHSTVLGYRLFSDTEGAEIKYTVDGSDPKTSDTAKVFDQTKFKAASDVGGAEVKELITIGADTDNWDGSAKQTKVELKAYASKAGMEDSEVVTFTYTIDLMSKMEHKSRLMYDMDSMKVWSVIDYDSDKMYLIKGSKGALLIDAGMASAGANNLYEYCKQLAGTLHFAWSSGSYHAAGRFRSGRPQGLHQRKGYPDGAAVCERQDRNGRRLYLHQRRLSV